MCVCLCQIVKAETNGKLTWSMSFQVMRDAKFYQRQFSFLTDNYSEHDLVMKRPNGMNKYDKNGKPLYVKRGAMRRFFSKNWKVLQMFHRLSLLFLALGRPYPWVMAAQMICYLVLYMYVKPLDKTYTDEHPWENNIIVYLALSNVVITLVGAIYISNTGGFNEFGKPARAFDCTKMEAMGVLVILMILVKYTIYVYYVIAARRVLLESAKNAGNKHMNLGHKIRGVFKFHANNCMVLFRCKKPTPPPEIQQQQAQEAAQKQAVVRQREQADLACQQASKQVMQSGGTPEEASKAAFSAFLDSGGDLEQAGAVASKAAIAAGGTKADAARAVETVCAQPGTFESEHDKRTAARRAKAAAMSNPITWAERVEGWRNGYATLLSKRPFRMMLYIAIGCAGLLGTLAIPGIPHMMDPGFDNFVPDGSSSQKDQDKVGQTSYRRLDALAAAPGLRNTTYGEDLAGYGQGDADSSYGIDLGKLLDDRLEDWRGYESGSGRADDNSSMGYAGDEDDNNIVDDILSQAERRRNLQGTQSVNLYFYHPTNMLTPELLTDLDQTDKEIRSWPEINSDVAPSLLDYYLLSIEPIDKFNIQFDRGSEPSQLNKEGIEAVSRFLLRARISHYTDECLCQNLTTKSTMIPYLYYDGQKDALVKKLRAYAHAKQQQHEKSGGVLVGYTYGWLVAYDRGMTILDDLKWAIGALTFVFFVVWFHLRSLWVTSMGMFHILMSFFMA
jgi:hypothetical protein